LAYRHKSFCFFCWRLAIKQWGNKGKEAWNKARRARGAWNKAKNLCRKVKRARRAWNKARRVREAWNKARIG
jgi:hypothetical protein